MTKQIRITQLREAVEAGNHVNLYPGAAAELLAEIDSLRADEPEVLLWGIDSIERIARQQGVFGSRDGNTLRLTGPVVITGPALRTKGDL